jgi:putative NADH-flavin reductase
MRILVLGATGAAGVLLVRDALVAFESKSLVLYVRSPSKLPEDIAAHPDVTVVKGELTDASALSQAFSSGIEAVLSTLGPLVSRGPFHPSDTPLAHAYKLVIQLMHEHHVPRLIVLGTSSIKDAHDKWSTKFGILIAGIAVFAHNAYKDVVAIGDIVRTDGEDLDWTVVRVPVLTDHPSTQVIAGYVGDHHTKTTLSRAALAHFFIEELQRGEWIKKAPLISSP